MKNLLIVDQSSLVYRAFYSYGHLEFRGMNTGVLYGFVKRLATLIETYGFIDIVSCMDTKPYFRKMLYKGYKSGRHKDKETLMLVKEGEKQIHDFLELAGIMQLYLCGLEADDLIAMITRDYLVEYDKIYVLSDDTDLFQLFYTDKIIFLRNDIKSKGFKEYRKKDFKKDFNIKFSEKYWHKVQAITGGHNSLQGIDGIGLKKALKYYNGEKLSEKDHSKIENNLKRIEQDYILTKLPFPLITRINKLQIKRDIIDGDNLLMFFEHFGFSQSHYFVNIFNW